MNNNKKITFFIMGEKGYTVLQYVLLRHKEIIENVVTAKDITIPEDYYEKIISLCNSSNIMCSDRQKELPSIGFFSIAISWKWLIHDKKTKLIVLHDSLLPKYRGFNPLVSMLINNEKTIGVTALFANEQYDRGDIISVSSSDITYPITIKEATKKISTNYVDVIEKIISVIKSGKEFKTIKQNEALATYSLWRDEDDYTIDWNKEAEYIKRFIDAVGLPYKGAKSKLHGKIVRIIRSEVVDDVYIENRCPGKIIFIDKGFPIVVCGKGLVKLTHVIDEESTSLLPLNKIRSKFT